MIYRCKQEMGEEWNIDNYEEYQVNRELDAIGTETKHGD